MNLSIKETVPDIVCSIGSLLIIVSLHIFPLSLWMGEKVPVEMISCNDFVCAMFNPIDAVFVVRPFSVWTLYASVMSSIFLVLSVWLISRTDKKMLAFSPLMILILFAIPFCTGINQRLIFNLPYGFILSAIGAIMIFISSFFPERNRTLTAIPIILFIISALSFAGAISMLAIQNVMNDNSYHIGNLFHSFLLGIITLVRGVTLRYKG